ncbi:unnamed protein product [Rotaria sp. Silwood1]|nr:unnamed protein product [Rotaria sp. Silwood1]CAF4734639.1 unnamed protein product [Rotaria sp. Silwood1]
MNTSISIDLSDQLIIDTLKSLQKQLTYTILIFLFIIGNIGCILNTIIFLRPCLNSSSSSRYFLASSFANGLLLHIGLATHILDVGFSIHPYHNISILCKLRNYLINMGGFLSQTYLLLACIDRYLISLNKSRYRSINTIPMANRIILFSACFWLTILSHMLIFSSISPRHHFCFFSSLSYSFFISLHNLILSGFILPILMVFFGLLTLKNIQRIRRQARSCRRRQRRYHYLSLMLISNVFVSVIFTLVYTSGLIYVSFFILTQENITSSRQKVQHRFISFIAIIFYYVPYSISFYVNILTSQHFRRELQKVLRLKRER